MNDEDIKKCLEHCVAKGQCKKCPLDKELLCFPVLEKNALDLINRQQAEVERLKSLCTSKDVIIKAQEAEIKQAKSEAIKECVNKYTEMLIDEYHLRTDLQIESIKRLEQKVMTEMVGGENA